MPYTVNPKPAAVIFAAELADHFLKLLAARNRYHSGFGLVTSGVSLNATLQTGEAHVAGYHVGKTGDPSTALTLVASATNYIYIGADGVVYQNTTGVAPTNTLLLWTAVTNGSGVTSTTDNRLTDVGIDAPFRAQKVTADGSDAALVGYRVDLSGLTPYVRLADTTGGGIEYRLYSKSGQFQVTDAAGTTVFLAISAGATTLTGTLTGTLPTSVVGSASIAPLGLNVPAATVNFTGATAQTGDVYAWLFNAPALTSTPASSVIGTAGTVVIAGPPTASGNASISTPYSLWVKAGNVAFAGNLTVAGGTIVPTVGPTSARQHTLPNVTSDTLVLLTATQTLSGKTLTAPVIGDFTNAGHNHQTAAGGGTLDVAAIATGVLGVPRGGTGLGTLTANYLVVGNGTSAATLLAPEAGAVRKFLSTVSGGAPGYATPVLAELSSAAQAVGQLLYSDATKPVGLATAATGAVLVSAGTAAPAWSTTPVVSGSLAIGGTLGSNAQSVLDLSQSTTKSLFLPQVPTASRPNAPSAGFMHWNTTTGSLELWNGSAWVAAAITTKNEWYLNPGAAILPNGTTMPLLSKVTGTASTFMQLEFDQVTSQNAFWNFEVPQSTNVTITVYWKAPTAPANRNVGWKIAYRDNPANALWDSSVTTTATTTTAASATAGNIVVTTFSITTPFTIDSMATLQLIRDTAVANNLADVAQVVGIKIKWA